MKATTFFLIFLTFSLFSFSQTKRNCIWTINDSTGIDFTDLQNIVPANNHALKGFEYVNASISDSFGSLLLYSNGRNLWGKNNNICINSDTLTCWGCQGSNFFLPSQSDSTVYYYFRTWDVNVVFNLEYSKIKTFANNSCELLSMQSRQMGGTYGSRKMIPIKHGNGKDWWIISFSRDNSQYCRMLFSNDSLYVFGNDSLNNAFINIQGTSSLSKIDVSNDGSKITQAFNNNDTTDVCVYNFDRCTGVITFDKRIFFRPDANLTQSDFFWVIRETVFSNDAKYVYALTWDTLYQLDANLDYTQQTPTVIWYDSNHVDYDDSVVMHFMERGPDGRIYISRPHATLSTFPDSVNRYLGVIDQIDNPFPIAHFTRKAFYLGGRKSYGGLVSAPNYDLGPWVGSPCDTLTTTGFSEQTIKPQITLFPNPAQTQATLTWSGLQEGTFVLRDMLGRALLQQSLSTNSCSIKLNLADFPKGIYLWQVRSKEHTQNGKLVVE